MSGMELNRRTLAVVIVAVVFFGVFGAMCVRKAVRGNDFYLHLVGKAIWKGERIYPVGETTEAVPGPDHFGFGKKSRPYYYSPFPAIIATPMAFVPPVVAATFWYSLKVCLLLLTLWLMAGIFDKFGLGRLKPYVLLVAVLFVMRFLDNDFQNGQTNVIVVFLVVLAIHCALSSREFAAGLLLALAATVKQPPLLFAVYWGMKKQWRAVAGCLVGLVIFLYVIPGFMVGFARIHQYNLNWFATMMYSPDGNSLAQALPIQGYATGHSLVAFLGRYLTRIDASPYDDVKWYINVVSMDPRLVGHMHKVISVLCVVGLWVLTLRRGKGESEAKWRTLVELGIVAVLTLLLSPYSRRAHFVMLLLPAAIYSYALFQCRMRSRFLWIAFLIPFVIAVFRTELMTVYGLLTVATILMLVGLVHLHVVGSPGIRAQHVP